MPAGNYNPLSDFTYDQLQYLYQESPVGSQLRSKVASQLTARQQGIQQYVRLDSKTNPLAKESMKKHHEGN